ncbi:NAD(P)-binding protein [Ophiobolus disseminans]|uniref:NAD(P)-binding protein n=1 Tax=Ophiobolus disseminans TaxID=1469910 RepID=A0A6A6ZJF0_9PLEO|nr:NAD(P)-binding protein [Ophiobolus disseminans]
MGPGLYASMSEVFGFLVAYGGYNIFVLSREASVEKSKELGAQFLAADYSSPASLVSVLEFNNIDTVISTLSSMIGADPELALIKAASASKVTRRYIPSMWGVKYTTDVAAIYPLAHDHIAALDALNASTLEHASVSNGFFLDYWGFPHVKSYLGPFPVVLDIANNAAAIPASGDVPVAFTYSFDVGRFVGKLLAESEWDKDYTIVGDKLSWNEFLALAEEVKGVKFDVKHDSLETLQLGRISELPGHVPLYPFFPKESLQGMCSMFEMLMAKGFLNLERSGSLNEKFPDVKTKSARELVTEAWKGK